MQKNIVISGSIAIDRIMNFDGHYKDYIQADNLESLSVSIFLENQNDTHGGVAANISYTLALLGERPALLGSVGPDAANYMKDLEALGVDISHLHNSSLPTAAFNVITDLSNNQIGGFHPGAMFDSDTLSFTPWKDSPTLAVIAPHDPNAMRRQVAECQELGIPYCYDIGQQVSNTDGDIMLEGVKGADILILNGYEMGVLSEKTGMSPLEIKATVPVVITTLGGKGSMIEGSKVGEPIMIDIVTPTDVQDPTGAGDAYRAGFFYGYVRDWPLKTSAQLGTVCAAYAIEHTGTQKHRFTLAEIAERYQKAFDEPLPINSTYAKSRYLQGQSGVLQKPFYLEEMEP